MPNILQGTTGPITGRFAIVVSRYNEHITGKLLAGAIETLPRRAWRTTTSTSPGFPVRGKFRSSPQRLARSNSTLAVLCLGAVIKGETTHDEHINRQVSLSLGQIALETGLPVLFGVLTCNTLEQAIHRSGGNVGNKGVECAQAALEMVRLLARLAE